MVSMRTLIFTLLFATLSTSTFAIGDKKQLKLRIQAAGGNLDEATVYFDQGISSGYIYQEDAEKVFNSVAGVPVIYSVTTDKRRCSVNGFGSLSGTEHIELGVDVDADGNYVITAPQLSNFDPTSIVRLEDRKNGVFTDMRANFYQAQIDASELPGGRFFLHVSYPVQVSPVVAGCQNNDGKFSVSADTSITWTLCQLFDAFNNPAGSFNNIKGKYDFTGLAEGDYYMVYVYGSYSTTKPLHLNGNSIVANIAASSQNVATGEEVNFDAIAPNSNQYSWDFGDGTQILGIAHPTLAYYEPGVYQVNLRCSNSAGCIDNTQITINVSQVTGVSEVSAKLPVSIIAQNKSLLVDLNSVETDAQMQVYNLLGQSVYSSPLNEQRASVNLEEQQNGYYVVSVKNAGKTTTQRVFLGK